MQAFEKKASQIRKNCKNHNLTMDYAPLYRSKRSLAALMAIAASCPFVQAGDYGSVGASTAYGTSSAGACYSSGQSDAARRAMARREQATQEAMQLVEEGRALYKQGEYKDALDKFKQANDVLPNAPILDQRRAFIGTLIGDASIATAQQYIKVGRYDEAEQLLLDAIKLSPKKEKLAKQTLEQMKDPVRCNPALTPEHVKNVEEVNRRLHMAFGYFELGQYDKALAEFNKVLSIDSTNVAARRGMETVNKYRAAYYKAAYDETRSSMLVAVDQIWETPIPREAPVMMNEGNEQPIDQTGATLNLHKLKTIVVPSVSFEDTTVEDAIDYLRKKSIELDKSNDGTRGINFVINDTDSGATPSSPIVSTDNEFGDEEEESVTTPTIDIPADIKGKKIKQLKLTNIPMIELLKNICSSAGLRYKVEDYVVSILPASSSGSDDLFTRTFTVPPGFMSTLNKSYGQDGGDSVDPFTSDSSASGIKPTPPLKTLLERAGIRFSDGASAAFVAGNSTLVVKNTTGNLDMIEQIIESTIGANKMIKVMTKFVEVTQENTDELSFDWVVTPFSLNGNRSLFGGGGPGLGADSADFVGAPNGVNNWPINTNNTNAVNGLATGGLRSGNEGIRTDGIDNLLRSQNRTQATQSTPAPGILSMTGIYDEGAFQMIMRGLSQKKGADVLTAPSITAKPGSNAKIQIIREFMYPESYSPPEIPTNVGNNGYNNNNNNDGEGGTAATVNSFPVTPANPDSFVMKPVGVTLEINPDIGENSYVVNLQFKPSIVEFEGFVNYGSPIQSTGIDSEGNPVSITLTENRIEQPIFSVREVETELLIYDGHTVSIGGLITESVQTVEDKVPIFGDLPLVGRFFRSNVENHIKKNLMIFVTAQIIDATGQPVYNKGAAAEAGPETALPVSGAGSDLLPPF